MLDEPPPTTKQKLTQLKHVLISFPSLNSKVVDSPATRQASLEAAEKSIVLLKNDGILPLTKALHPKMPCAP